MKPTSTPTTLLTVIFSSTSTMAAMGMTNSGTLAFSVAARVESTLCSAQVMSEKGSATLRTAMTRRCPYMPIRRGSASRAITTTATRSRKPNRSLTATRVNGVSPASTPILMNR